MGRQSETPAWQRKTALLEALPGIPGIPGTRRKNAARRADWHLLPGTGVVAAGAASPDLQTPIAASDVQPRLAPFSEVQTGADTSLGYLLRQSGRRLYVERQTNVAHGWASLQCCEFTDREAFLAWLALDPLRFDYADLQGRVRLAGETMLSALSGPIAGPIAVSDAGREARATATSLRFTRTIDDTIDRIAKVGDRGSLLALLRQAVRRLGADQGVLINVASNKDGPTAIQLVQACDPRWGQEYLELTAAEQAAWLASALASGKPQVMASAREDDGTPAVLDLARRYGFGSVVVAAYRPALGSMYTSVLVLGAKRPDHFNGDGLTRFKRKARELLVELHQWWLGRVAEGIVGSEPLSARDREVLSRFLVGQRSKEIVRDMPGWPHPAAVDAHAVKLMQRFNVDSRGEAAQLAAECGLIEPIAIAGVSPVGSSAG